MNTIRVIGQAISSTNYATNRSFNFNPEMVKAMAENYLASGINEVEIPQGVLDPDNRFPDTGLDKEKVAQTVKLMPKECKVVATYVGGKGLGDDNATYVASVKRTLDDFCTYFPDCKFAMVHPAPAKFGNRAAIEGVVKAWVELADYVARKHKGFQLGFHNHYDSSGETAEQVRWHLEAIEKAARPNLGWAPDTGHCHGMKGEYLDVFAQYAHLIKNGFHIKAKISAFDSRHDPDKHRPDRDIWNNAAEFGRGLYGGFVCCADPEIETPFKEIFKLIREKAKPDAGIVRGSMEIDVPRQHPRLEIMCAVLYLKRVHKVETGMALDYKTIVERVFPV